VLWWLRPELKDCESLLSVSWERCDGSLEAKRYRKLHCLATAMSRDSRREQSNCVDRVGRIFEMVRSFCRNFETSKAECGKVLVTSALHKPRHDPVLVPTFERHRWIDRRSYWCCKYKHARSRNGFANLISLQLVYGYIKLNININITGMLNIRQCIAEAH
jgi:hypothetical protein